MGALVAKIIENENAIGYASYGVSKQNEGKLFQLKVDGVAAAPDTITDGAYKIQRPLLIVGSGKLKAIQKAFMDYLRSDAGMAVIEKWALSLLNKSHENRRKYYKGSRNSDGAADNRRLPVSIPLYRL